MKKYFSLAICVIVSSIVFGTIYGTAQQILRLNANNQPVQIAEDIADKLKSGVKPSNELLGNAVAPDISLAPFISIYDKSGALVATSATATPALPAIPFGVLKASEGKDYNAVTWAPTPTLRLASVTVAARDYYVTSAQSLRETEKHIKVIGKIVATGWLLTLLCFGAYFYLKDTKN